MKRIILSALCVIPAFCMGQTLLYNDGAMVKVQAGATLFVEGGIQNTATGTIDNDGTIEVKGNFLNQGTWDPNQPNTIIFSGNVDSDVTSGTAIFQNVVIAKDDTYDVNILDHMTINDTLDFNAAGTSKLYTGNNRLKIGNSGVVTGYDANEYVVTNGTGEMEKKVNADGTFFFPVGDAVNYTPLESTYAGSAYSSAKIRTHVNNAVHPNNPADATEFINRYWNVNAIGITDYTNDMTGTYIPADVVLGAGGTAAQVKGAVYDGVNWAYAGADSGTNQVMGTTDVATAEFTGANFFTEALNLKAFLQGPYNTTTGVMSSVYSTNQTIEPLLYISPYTDAPDTVVDVPSGVTDWVKIELREANSPTTILARTSAFIRDSGYIVGTDGVSKPRIKNGSPTAIVAIVHRMHLAIRTPNAGIDVLDPTLYDFSADTLNAYRNVGNNQNASMLYIPTTDRFVMWGANGNANANVRYGGPANDRDYLLGTILGGNPTMVISNTYSTGDYNMNGQVRYGGPNNDRDFLLAKVLEGNTTKVRNRHF